MIDLADEIESARQERHDIDAVVDRLVVRSEIRSWFNESIEIALESAAGLATLDVLGDADSDGEEWLFSPSSACVDCGVSYPEIAPRMPSFNSPSGTCPECDGLGVRYEFDPQLVVRDPGHPLEIAIEAWSRRQERRYYRGVLASLAKQMGVPTATPWRKLPASVRSGISHGLGGEPVRLCFSELAESERVEVPWDGFIGDLESRFEANGRALEISNAIGLRFLAAVSRGCTSASMGGVRDEERRLTGCGVVPDGCCAGEAAGWGNRGAYGVVTAGSVE